MFEYYLKPLERKEYLYLYTASIIALVFAVYTFLFTDKNIMVYLFVALALNPVVVNTIIYLQTYLVYKVKVFRLQFFYSGLSNAEQSQFDNEIARRISGTKKGR